jgi:hypothetical protein
MTQEEKSLLLQDLCARLPYGVKVYALFDKEKPLIREMGLGTLHDFMFNDLEVKPYLRPMSSMTEEEKKELERLIDEKLNKHIGQEDDEWTPWVLYDTTGIKNYVGGERFYFDEMSFIYDWLNKHHFDYRGLIEKGLALEALEGMYKHFGDMDVVVTSVEHKDKL